MSTRVFNSAVIAAPISKVWAVVRPLDFVWNTRVITHALEGKEDTDTTVGSQRVVYYQDQTKQKIRLTALSDATHSLTYELIESIPAVPHSGAVHTITLRRVTANDTTFIEWTSDFAADATTAVTEDAKYKQLESFKMIAAAAAKEFSFKSTAEEVAAKSNLKGQLVLITGANSGIGFETARVLAGRGATVLVGARDQTKADAAVAQLKQQNPNTSGVFEPFVINLETLAAVRASAKSFLDSKRGLNVLILNAGVMAPPRAETGDKIELMFGVNHVAHHLFTTLLLPALKQAQPSRVVVLSSGAHWRHGINWEDIQWSKKYDKWLAYGQSKTANILFANHLNKLLQKEGAKVTVNSVHPGVIMTNLGRSLTDEDKKGLFDPEAPRFRWKTTAQGAATTVVAALLPQFGAEGGHYLADCQIAPVAKWVTDDEAAKLWDFTEKLIAEKSK